MKRGYKGIMKAGDGITNKEKRFAEEYIKDFNATRAGREAGYGVNSKDSVVTVLMVAVKNKPAVKQYIAELQSELEEMAGISRYRVLQEYAKIAFSSFGDFFRGWMDMKSFDELTEMQKAAIAEVQEVTKYVDGEPVVGVRIKLHDKIRALDSISRMLGYDSPLKVDLTTLGKELMHAPVINVYNVGPPLAESEQDIKE